jgi:uncharacterized protein with HEPN domain
MAAPDSQLYLVQMLDNIERIRLWTSGHTLETYRANLMLRDAVERRLERISEASRRLPQEVKATQPLRRPGGSSTTTCPLCDVPSSR